MKNLISKTSIIAAALAVAGLSTAVAAPAVAAPPVISSSDFEVGFTYDREDLETEEGVQKLLRRMERQVRSQCGVSSRLLTQDRKAVRECVDSTMKNTIAKIGSESLAAAYTRSAG